MFFPVAYGGKRFLNCVWVRLLPMGPRDHMQERSYLRHSLYYPWGERKLGETVAHGAKSLHTREDNIMLVMNGWRHMIFSYCS